jgi:hypothetical protein
MNGGRLQEMIWQGIRKEVCEDCVKLYLPFFFGHKNDEPLCLTWNRKGILSDGGRTISELERRLGNIQPYQNMIISLLSRCGDCKLVGGRTIVKEHFQKVISPDGEYWDYLAGMNQMLKAITQISVIESIQFNEDGTVSI